MRNEELAQRLKEAFVLELRDHVGSLSKELLALEKDASVDQQAQSWPVLFRVTHTLKGASAVVNIQSVRDACHYMEDIFGVYRDSGQPMPEELTSKLLATVDAFEETGASFGADQDTSNGPLLELVPELKRLAEELTEPPQKGQVSPREAAVPRKSASPESAANQKPEPSPAAANKVSQSAAKSKPKPKPKSTPKPKRQPPLAPEQEPAPRKPLVVTEQAASIRVPAEKLDALLAHSGELLVARGRFALRARDASELRDCAGDLRAFWSDTRKHLRQLEDAAAHANPHVAKLTEQTTQEMTKQLFSFTKRLDDLSSGMDADNRLLSQTCGLLDDEVYRVRMLPFSDACVGLERAVRDTAKSTKKQVQLQIEGADVEVDRSVLEGLKDPLLHIVRNAVDHGIESPAERVAAGKPAAGTLTISASLRGGQVEVRVEDDGGGIDLQRICELAEKRGFEVPDDAREQMRLVFAPGFSTAKMITDISGRGVGLDVVQSRVESLHGQVDINFKTGKGTCFILMVPLTLTTIRCMLVQVSDQVYAIPTSSVQRLVRFSVSEVRSSAGRDTLLLREAPTPLVSLATTLALKSKGMATRTSGKGLAVVLSTGDHRVALLVDEVLSEQEILVKNLGARIRKLRHFSGCTLLPTGRIALVVNAANVVRSALGAEATLSQFGQAKRDEWVRKQVLLADDSVTTRMLLKNILETAGYDVTEAVDGQQAWEFAQQHEFDAVVSDVDMPRTDGFMLTSKLRAAEATAEVPIVLVTARGSDKDKEQGVKVGASAYIIKGTFDQQNLLDTLAQLV